MIGCLLAAGPATSVEFQGQDPPELQGHGQSGQFPVTNIGGVSEWLPQPSPMQPSIGQAEQVAGCAAQESGIVIKKSSTGVNRCDPLRLIRISRAFHKKQLNALPVT